MPRFALPLLFYKMSLKREVFDMWRPSHTMYFFQIFISECYGLATHVQQGQRKAWRIPSPKNLTRWPWPWKSIGFQILLRTKYVPSLVKIHSRMLILECSQGCYGRTDGRQRYYIPSQLRWRGDNNLITMSCCITVIYSENWQFVNLFCLLSTRNKGTSIKKIIGRRISSGNWQNITWTVQPILHFPNGPAKIITRDYPNRYIVSRKGKTNLSDKANHLKIYRAYLTTGI